PTRRSSDLRLPWGVDGLPARPDSLPDGSGLAALEAFLSLGLGAPPTPTQLHQYLRRHHGELNLAGDPRGGNDYLDGGAGNDVLDRKSTRLNSSHVKIS